MTKSICITVLTLILTGCSSTPTVHLPQRVHVEGVCVHPLIKAGAPFEVGEETLFDGKNLYLVMPEQQKEYILLNAQCQFTRDTSEDKKETPK